MKSLNKVTKADNKFFSLILEAVIIKVPLNFKRWTQEFLGQNLRNKIFNT